MLVHCWSLGLSAKAKQKTKNNRLEMSRGRGISRSFLPGGGARRSCRMQYDENKTQNSDPSHSTGDQSINDLWGFNGKHTVGKPRNNPNI
jgi:hypothetical protein